MTATVRSNLVSRLCTLRACLPRHRVTRKLGNQCGRKRSSFFRIQDQRKAARLLSTMPSRVTIQKYNVTVLEAIYHVVAHIFATKMLTGEDLGFYKHLKAATHTEKAP